MHMHIDGMSWDFTGVLWMSTLDMTKSSPVWTPTLCLALNALEYIIQGRWTQRKKRGLWGEGWTRRGKKGKDGRAKIIAGCALSYWRWPRDVHGRLGNEVTIKGKASGLCLLQQSAGQWDNERLSWATFGLWPKERCMSCQIDTLWSLAEMRW